MRALLCAGLCASAALGCSATAYAQTSASAQGQATATLQDSAGILVSQDLTFQSQLSTSSVNGAAAAAAAGAASTVGSGASAGSASSANVTVLGASGDTVSMAVPTTFDVTRAGGPEAFVVTTFGVGGSSILGGGLRANGALSVDVSGRVALAGRSEVPGAYRGLLVVIAQYN